MDHFELVSEYKPTGDQPQAIEELVEGFKKGKQFQTLKPSLCRNISIGLPKICCLI